MLSNYNTCLFHSIVQVELYSFFFIAYSLASAVVAAIGWCRGRLLSVDPSPTRDPSRPQVLLYTCQNEPPAAAAAFPLFHQQLRSFLAVVNRPVPEFPPQHARASCLILTRASRTHTMAASMPKSTATHTKSSTAPEATSAERCLLSRAVNGPTEPLRLALAGKF